LDDDDKDMTTLELVAATALFGWECPSAWKSISHFAYIIAVDPFFDLFAMSCIVANTVLLALDHSDIDPDMATALLIGNHVRFTRCFLCHVIDSPPPAPYFASVSVDQSVSY